MRASTIRTIRDFIVDELGREQDLICYCSDDERKEIMEEWDIEED